MSADFVYCDIMNTGWIPYIGKRGPLFGEHLAIGVYDFLVQDPRIEIYLTSRRDSEIRKKKYLDSLKPKEESKPIIEQLKTPDIKYTWFDPNVTEPTNTEVKTDEITNEQPTNSSSTTQLTDDQINDLLGRLTTIQTEEKQPDIIIPTEVSNPIVESTETTKIPIRYDYTDEELRKKTRKELAQILISMGHTPGIRGNAHAKENDDKLGPRYQDTRTILISKIKKVIAQEHTKTEETTEDNKETSEN